MESARPAFKAACRAGFCPKPACKTLPMITSSTWVPSTPARLSASVITIFPRSIVLTLASEPLKLPTGVRVALTITTFSIIIP